jgi:hypothetical protein
VPARSLQMTRWSVTGSSMTSFSQEARMWDLGCLGASVLFFAIAIGYTTACERLGAKEKQG